MSTKEQSDGSVIEKEDIKKSEPPRMFNVILINDDYTPMNFVTSVLTDIFNKNEDQAVQIMLDVHKKGKGVAGTYTRDIAEMRTEKAIARARRESHPLQVTFEPA